MGDSPRVAFPAAITQRYGTDTSVDVVLATTPQEGGQKALDSILTFLTERKYKQSIKHEKKNVSGTRLSTTIQGQTPLAPNLDAPTFASTSDNLFYRWSPDPNHTLRMRKGPYIPPKVPGRTSHFQASNRKLENLLRLILARATFSYISRPPPSAQPQCCCDTTRKRILHRRTRKP